MTKHIKLEDGCYGMCRFHKYGKYFSINNECKCSAKYKCYYCKGLFCKNHIGIKHDIYRYSQLRDVCSYELLQSFPREFISLEQFILDKIEKKLHIINNNKIKRLLTVVCDRQTIYNTMINIMAEESGYSNITRHEYFQTYGAKNIMYDKLYSKLKSSSKLYSSELKELFIYAKKYVPIYSISVSCYRSDYYWEPYYNKDKLLNFAKLVTKQIMNNNSYLYDMIKQEYIDTYYTKMQKLITMVKIKHFPIHGCNFIPKKIPIIMNKYNNITIITCY